MVHVVLEGGSFAAQIPLLDACHEDGNLHCPRATYTLQMAPFIRYLHRLMYITSSGSVLVLQEGVSSSNHLEYS